ncbi:tyrosine-tRNA ligase [Tieghemostelium lacteum]|uniref:tyrosine--tRNA ligase n=1 Tax=Tieghemostelium lacteum TaxID=361077 RepID=A0A151ZK53_TIELA|nr:tyrosine-tRNA ligase [Tieghemostelium lacteum]|eukprot:KYQ94326.1 tyrosine-tRNA ligase [Tieghemostelium lacteum]
MSTIEVTKELENLKVEETKTTTTTTDKDTKVATTPIPPTIVPKDDVVAKRLELIRLVGEEIVSEDNLIRLLNGKEKLRCYDGFEPSGRMHIAQGILKSINVNRMVGAGCKFIFWVADWFAMLNNKMNGDLKKIRKVGEYMIEIWKATGMDMENVEFLWSSDEINKNANDYWLRVMDISRKFNIPRIKKCSKIMGRDEQDDLSVAQLLYPCMQCADIFFLKADICQLGMDQRKVNMLAIEYCDKLKIKNKPIIVSHHMLSGLKEGQEKMSKSDPDSAIFMEDTEQDVNSKIRKAFCPPGVVEGNPILDYCKHIIFQKVDSLSIEKQNVGEVKFNSYKELEDAFVKLEVHPSELKPAVSKAINLMLQPVRDHFVNNKEAADLLKTVRSYAVTK